MREIIQMKKNENTSKENHVSQDISSNPERQVPKRPQTRSMAINQDGKTSLHEVMLLMKGIQPTRLDVWVEFRSRGKGRRCKQAITQVLSSFQKDKEELLKLKERMIEEREKMEQVKEELFQEKERMNLLSKKLEALISQFPAISKSPQVADSSTLNQTTLIRPRNSPSSEEEQVYVEKSLMPNEKLTKTQEGVQKIGDAVHKCIEWEIVNVMEI